MATFTCDVCSEPFNRAPAHAARNRMGMFCSRECFGRYERDHHNPGWTGGHAVLECRHCLTPFSCKRSEAARRRYCSNACVSQAAKEKRRTECEQCGASFIPPRAGQRFCGRDCAGVVHRTTVRGEGNGRFLHGGWETAYTLGFTDKVRDSIRARDRNRCVVCDEENLILQVHHIDGSKDNHRPNNLATVCIACHRKVHTKAGINAKWMAIFEPALREAAARPVPS